MQTSSFTGVVDITWRLCELSLMVGFIIYELKRLSSLIYYKSRHFYAMLGGISSPGKIQSLTNVSPLSSTIDDYR